MSPRKSLFSVDAAVLCAPFVHHVENSLEQWNNTVNFTDMKVMGKGVVRDVLPSSPVE